MMVKSVLRWIKHSTNINLCIELIKNRSIPSPYDDTVFEFLCILHQCSSHHFITMKSITMSANQLVFTTQLLILQVIRCELFLLLCPNNHQLICHHRYIIIHVHELWLLCLVSLHIFRFSFT